MKYSCDDQVYYKGHLWDVISEYGGIVKLKREGETVDARKAEVKLSETERSYLV